MDSPEPLKAAEQKMHGALLAYTERNRNDSELHDHLVDDLRTATTEFLEARSQFALGRPATSD
ncbi:MAG: hypothetical protein ABR973_16130 [Candidatus Acidiferrales bacterium]|jgi:hypothetical protein